MATDVASTQFHITHITGNEDRLFAFINSFVQDNKDAYTPGYSNSMSWIVEEIYGWGDNQDWSRDWRPMMAGGKLTFSEDECGCFETSECVSKFATLLAEQIPEVGFKAKVHVVFYVTGDEFAETFKSAPGRSEVVTNYRDGGDLSLDEDDRYLYRGNKSITVVNVPEDWTEISDIAFQFCKSLLGVNIPEGVTRIGNYAFQDCKSLMSIEIPSSVVEIGTGAFSKCKSLKSVKLHEGLKKIGQGAFEKCDSLESFEIPDTVTEIGDRPFEKCKSLKSLEVPESLKTFGEASLSAPYVRFVGCRASTVGSTAFSVKLPEKIWVEDIACLTPALRPAAAVCFAEDPSGSEQRQTSHLKYIKTNTSRLVSHTKDHPALLALMVKHGLIGEDGLPAQPDISQAGGQLPTEEFEIAGSTLVAYAGPGGDVSIPQGVTEIGEDAFWHCDTLKSVTIPEGVTGICDHAFKGCGRLKSIELPKSMTEIGKGAFERCRSLKSITIPAGVTRIGVSAFERCGSLEATIESGCTALIEDWAFKKCKSVTVPESVEKLCEGALSASYVRLPGIRVPAAGVHAFGDGLPERIWAEHLNSLTAQMKPAAVLGFAEDPSGSDQRRASHIKYIKSHIPLTVANPSLLDLVIKEWLITAKTLPAYLEEARKTENTEAVAKLMEYAKTLGKPGSDLEF